MYAELHALSNFTFLRGASQPAELVTRAHELGYRALAVTDECSLAGIVRAHVAAKKQGLQLVVGAEFRFDDGLKFIALATDRTGYGALASFITRGRRAADKGSYLLTRADLEGALDRCLMLWLPGAQPDANAGRWLRERFEGRLWIAVELLTSGSDRRRLAALEQLGAKIEVPCVASGDVHMHVRGRRALQDVVTAIRLRTPVAAAGFALYPNGERHLRPLERLAELYPPKLLDATLEIAGRCHFSLDELRYEYPQELVPPGETPASYLGRLTEEGLQRRWPLGASEQVRDLVARELALIRDLGYEPYFLTVHDLVRFARSVGILCQGRGSAANSAVCYCLGVTEVDPARSQLLFERFISRERNEPPDIDIDFEHERREEVIQYVYGKYGRERAAIAATVITYHAKSALRDVGKALGLDELQVDRLARAVSWTDGLKLDDERVREAGFDPGNALIGRLIALTRSLLGFPRHLSQHVGGFVISRGRLDELVPVENAAMPERTVIEWDKDDLDDLGLIKVDVLGLGMLTAIRRAFVFLTACRGRTFAMADIPADDSRVYDMICRADTTGVFQIESRAQMAMLPRLKPRNYYDLVIEVALVRPGPIQGDMVHPYLRRRSGEEPVTYPSEGVERVLKRTLGVPIFQEQVMQLAIVAAGFTPGEADRLRRAMAAWKRRGGLEPFEEQLKSGMLARGYNIEFAQQIFRQIRGFGEYGFPESHAASFALLVYVSAWLKCHEPAAFTGALINSQPMGFYPPSQLVRDARAHGVEVRPVDIAASDWDATLERRSDGEPALRLGFRMVKGLSESGARRILEARAVQIFTSTQDLATRAALDRRDLGALANAGALEVLAGHRHQAAWSMAGVEPPLPLIAGVEIVEGIPLLRAPTEGQDIVADYRSVGLTLGRHPLALLRERLSRDGIATAEGLLQLADGAPIRTAGLVITRQRPMTASGVTFVTLEDETGHINLVVWLQVAERQRRVFLEARLLEVCGKLQRQDSVLHVIVTSMRDRSKLLGNLQARSRDFH